MVPLIDIFDVWYGVNLEVVNSEVVSAGIPFVSRQSVNNGVVCHVKKMDDVEPNPSHTLSIAVSGSVLSTFYHDYEYYSGRDIYVAKPKIKLTKEEMLYYCYVIEQNKYRYNYGRGANKTFRSILVPSKDEIPKYVRTKEAEIRFCNKPIISNKIKLNTDSWKWFRYDEIFEIKKGKRLTKADMQDGDVPYIGAIDSNNGISAYISNDEHLHQGNTITVSYNGSIAEAFYQTTKFWATDDVNVLYPKFALNRYIAMFLITLIHREKYRFNYGRKWDKELMESSLIKLPAVKIAPNEYEPDWQFMEDYIKSLPYSSSL
ncbi:Type I restriction modification DNA specificity domain-containing protein [Fibrobacter sp. UWOV1]|uniref:restriction endonuclease subunit S n=1 Tax=Fibrobacter sp. UWOV1 TaxID=1896215 RepID=UPI0009135EEA|nr:restriction endonuclease subunit S [Fibrobacter sp. UWOV1]SHK40820.1 Type I restriction modification DNA specificity domain-containing protein [Fibrobacter sp. UWOV1]